MSLVARAVRQHALSPEELTVAWQAASLLLDYPDADLLTRLPMLATAASRLPGLVGEPLADTVEALSSTDLSTLEQDYVATFDRNRRHSLYLTYFSHGDTRKRGMALLRFREVYRRHGVCNVDSELPDHLGLVLEFAATVDQSDGRDLLLAHRAGIEVLRISLREAGSRWAGAVQAVCATLLPLSGTDEELVARLVAQGPPEEEVGLAPYPVSGPDTPIDLPMPTVLAGNRGGDPR